MNKPYQVDCSFCDREMVESETISAALADNRIVSVKIQEDGRFRVREECDEYFAGYLTADQLKAWGLELIAQAEGREASHYAPESSTTRPPA